MYRSFYQFILTYTDPHKKDVQTQFANIVAEDVGFPKHSQVHQDLLEYVELTDLYSEYMHVFDELWEVYLELNTRQ